ncbi:MAG: serine acetyltransferase [Deltaproteobacteria bacterium]|nr:serine acetyltransferase [Deltaproteobacteria bacterium]
MSETDKAAPTPLCDGPERDLELCDVVGALTDARNAIALPLRGPGRRGVLPSSAVVLEAIEGLRSVLFPGYFGFSEVPEGSRAYHVGATLDHVQRVLQEQIWRGLCFACERSSDHCEECEQGSQDITRRFLSRLPDVRRMLATDVRAGYEGDPAATSPDEVVFCYPGLRAIVSYRLAHELYELRVPIIPRMITEHAHSLTGIDIHPGARIGEFFFIDHGTGVVIGETTVIGNRVRLYQGVTLGARSFPLDEHGNPIKNVPRHPIVEDDVIIYSGATILGRVTIGRGSTVGGNVWLTTGVPPGSRVTQVEVKQETFLSGSGI